MSSLDLLNTSQTKKTYPKGKKPKNDRKIYDLCQNGAPYFAYEIGIKKWGVMQGYCNDWNCPRCGDQIAKQNYGRIVEGARHFGSTEKLYMLTVTCRGSEITYEQAEANYLEWTNRLLTRLRVETKRADKIWAYASVTERQKRLHPHSHYLTTYCPTDATYIKKGGEKRYFTSGEVFPAKHNTLQSRLLEQACVDCGLGRQYDISELESVEGASRYVAKYLFKAAVSQTVWPDGWRRVRYSRNWPKLPEKESNAIVLLNPVDWYNLTITATQIVTQDDSVKYKAEQMIGYTGISIL